MTGREAGGKTPAGSGRSGEERVVIRDKRKIDGTARARPGGSRPADGGGVPEPDRPDGPVADRASADRAAEDRAGAQPAAGTPGGTAKAGTTSRATEAGATEAGTASRADGGRAGSANRGPAGTEDGGPAPAGTAGAGPGEPTAAEARGGSGPGGTATGTVPAEPTIEEAAADEAEAAPTVQPGPLGAELAALRSELDERIGDLQRVTAEYANYRKRVDRDRTLVVEQATGAVLAALLPILDDLDRAREHGDLVGPFGAVAEQLTTALGKFGLTPFGEKGDTFDPTRHEAVAHQTSADVEEPTCVEVMRRGYLLGDRLLRPALVAVADPE